ncbi:MAG: RHS repeat-associated core domain-containing protein, partial [Firmicutes bacterium]|nr:RHS repeat-associated core domain-containing protein [Bacillota bacterium]
NRATLYYQHTLYQPRSRWEVFSRLQAGYSCIYHTSYDVADELLSAGSLSFVWDGNGNLLQKTNGTATTNFAYDFENHVKHVTFLNASTESYRYNGDGLRIAKIPPSGPPINYFLSGSDVWREESSPGGPPSTDYILAGSMAGPLGLKQPGSPNPVYHYTLGDGQGSIMGVTDDAGTITDQYQYEAWGNPVNLPNPPPNQTYNPYHYTGQQSDSSTGLYYLRNRYYDAQAGRFITEDPIGFEGGTNFYAYCRNNPANFADPSGELLPLIIAGVVLISAAIYVYEVQPSEASKAGVSNEEVNVAMQQLSQSSPNLSQQQQANYQQILVGYQNIYPNLVSPACGLAAANVADSLNAQFSQAKMFPSDEYYSIGLASTQTANGPTQYNPSNYTEIIVDQNTSIYLYTGSDRSSPHIQVVHKTNQKSRLIKKECPK